MEDYPICPLLSSISKVFSKKYFQDGNKPRNPVIYCECYQKLGHKISYKEAALGLFVYSRLLFEFRIFIFELIDSTRRIN